MKMAAKIVAGIFFACVAAIQFTRLYLQFPIVIGNATFPLWSNIIFFLVTCLLSLWLFMTASKK